MFDSYVRSLHDVVKAKDTLQANCNNLKFVHRHLIYSTRTPGQSLKTLITKFSYILPRLCVEFICRYRLTLSKEKTLYFTASLRCFFNSMGIVDQFGFICLYRIRRFSTTAGYLRWLPIKHKNQTWAKTNEKRRRRIGRNVRIITLKYRPILFQM